LPLRVLCVLRGLQFVPLIHEIHTHAANVPSVTNAVNRSTLLGLPRPVWLLGWVSLATDAATEAIYPLLPFFLTRVLGAGAVSLGIVEGAAEAVNSVLKIVSGRLADRAPAKRPLVLLGYAISSIARPFIAIATSWTQVFTVRALDRVGKGIRGAPRDAMLALWATPQTRGKVYGFHRAMDHTGAVAGPLLASLFLFIYPDRYRTLFALTIVPGAIAVALIFLVREDDRTADGSGRGGSRAAPTAAAVADTATSAPLSRQFRWFMIVLAIFTLGNSTDAFLLLKLTDAAGSPRFVPAMWAALHLVKAVVSVAGGSWSDRIGRRAVIATGWFVYAAVYAGFAFSDTLPALIAWFLAYGLYFGFAEGTEKALVADLTTTASRGLAFGIYNAVQGLGALAASVVFGLIWRVYGSAAAFGLGAALALAATALLFVIIVPPDAADSRDQR
jgi:MFS family permease